MSVCIHYIGQKDIWLVRIITYTQRVEKRGGREGERERVSEVTAVLTSTEIRALHTLISVHTYPKNLLGSVNVNETLLRYGNIAQVWKHSQCLNLGSPKVCVKKC